MKIPDYETRLAAVLVQTGALNEAESLLKSARTAILKKETAQSARLVDLLLVQSGISLKRKQAEAALKQAQEALDICHLHFPQVHILTGQSLKSVADCRLALKQPNLAKAFYTDALAILEQTMGADDVMTREAREKLASLDQPAVPEKVSPAKSSGKRARGK
jgi:tetratricopeptide (TPR) repeat protein